MPTAHNPTATTLKDDRRGALVEIAERYGVTIIEWSGSIPKREGAQRPLAALAPHRTIHIADLAACAIGGLRLGIVTAPSESLDQIGREIVSQHRQLPGLLAGLLEALAGPGAYEAAIEVQSRLLAERRDVFRRALGEAVASLTTVETHGWLPPMPARSWASFCFTPGTTVW